MNLFSKYYYDQVERIVNQIVPEGMKVYDSRRKTSLNGSYDYIVLANSLANVSDIQSYLDHLKKHSRQGSRVVVIYYNFLWKPFLDAASKIGFRKRDVPDQNWLTFGDTTNLFKLEGFDEVKSQRMLLLPVNLGPISWFINNFLGQLPLINNFCLVTCQVFRYIPVSKEYSVSIIIPARNEAGHMKGVLRKVPKFGKDQEVIFVEGNSKDDTYQVIEKEVKGYKGKAFLYKQTGKGKGDAVRLGFSKAKNDILMILDADLTVDPNDLPKFYRVLSGGLGDFANGSRLVYPMEGEAMRTLNYLGNKFFSLAFTYLLGQRVKDTLCGTKVLFREDYLKISKNRKFFGDFDPFGDYDLLFGATKLNLKIVEVPVRYKRRVYGTTNISRFSHGFLLLKMTLFAARKLKFI